MTMFLDDVDPVEENRIRKLDSLGQSLTKKRREAVAARAASGIETEWEGDEEFYQGYDDANRGEFVNTVTKPRENGGTSEVKASRVGSTVFPNISQPYIDAAAARVGDMLLPTDDRNFAIESTPIPNMMDDLPEDVKSKIGKEEVPMQVGDQLIDASQVVDQINKMKHDADIKSSKAQRRIDDWLTECQYHAELRYVIDDCARIGSGVIKGPVPVIRKSRKWEKKDGVYQLTIVEEIKPASYRVDPWNFYPDPACGDSIHKGAFVWERDSITEKSLRGFIGLPSYIESQIEKCIEEGADGSHEADAPNVNTPSSTKGKYEIWYFHGMVTVDDLRAAGCDCDDEQKSLPAMVTMVNDRVIRASLNPLESGDFPYDVIPWKRRPGLPFGMGVGRQIRTAQRMVVAATRNLMDNAGLASGPQIVVRRGVEPENNIWEIKPLKVWVENDEADGQTGAPFLAVTFPMLQNELMAIIQLGMKFAEDTTGLPMLMQGNQGAAPDTVGGMTILNNNANSVLRRVARLFDSSITEPHIRRYYSWLMEHGEDDEEKGDFQIVARGSSALIERDLQSQEMVNVVQLCLNPAFKKNPSKAMDEYLKSRRFDPAAFDYTEAELKQIQSAPPPVAPQVEVAKIRQETEMQKLQMTLQDDLAENQLNRQQAQDQFNANYQLEQLKVQIAQMKVEVDAQLGAANLDTSERMALENIKADLSGITMKLRTQKELSQQVLTPPSEPEGRAPAGEAFQK